MFQRGTTGSGGSALASAGSSNPDLTGQKPSSNRAALQAMGEAALMITMTLIIIIIMVMIIIINQFTGSLMEQS